MRATTPCFPMKRRSRPSASPAALLARLREVVFKLIMMSAMSRGGGVRRPGVTSVPAATRSNQQRHQDSHQSEAVEDCIEFFRKSASRPGCGVNLPALPPAKAADDDCAEAGGMEVQVA